MQVRSRTPRIDATSGADRSDLAVPPPQQARLSCGSDRRSGARRRRDEPVGPIRATSRPRQAAGSPLAACSMPGAMPSCVAPAREAVEGTGDGFGLVAERIATAVGHGPPAAAAPRSSPGRSGGARAVRTRWDGQWSSAATVSSRSKTDRKRQPDAGETPEEGDVLTFIGLIPRTL